MGKTYLFPFETRVFHYPNSGNSLPEFEYRIRVIFSSRVFHYSNFGLPGTDEQHYIVPLTSNTKTIVRFETQLLPQTLKQIYNSTSQ